MCGLIKNTLSRMERSRAKHREAENPRERTPFQKEWLDEYQTLAAEVDRVIQSKSTDNVEPLKERPLDFRSRWEKYVEGKFASSAVLNIDTLLRKLEKPDEAKEVAE